MVLCTSINGCADDSSTGRSPTPLGDGTVTGNDGGITQADAGIAVDPPACADLTLPNTIPAEVMGNTGEAEDTVEPPNCVRRGTRRSKDLVVFFVAPKAGEYRFSTTGSDFDTVLHARADDCTGAVLDCNDDAVEKASAIKLDLEAGQTIVLVVDGFNRETGQVVLRVEGQEDICDDGIDQDGDGAIDCADTDCFLSCEDPFDWPEDWIAFEEEVLTRTNEARAAGANCGGQTYPPAGPLEMDQFLVYSSRLHGRDMGMNNYFEHETQDGRSPDDRMRQVGFEGDGPTGENIAAGQSTPAEVMDSWMNSPGHCRNIMDSDYHVMGVGFVNVDGSSFGQYWVQNFGGSH